MENDGHLSPTSSDDPKSGPLSSDPNSKIHSSRSRVFRRIQFTHQPQAKIIRITNHFSPEFTMPFGSSSRPSSPKGSPRGSISSCSEVNVSSMDDPQQPLQQQQQQPACQQSFSHKHSGSTSSQVDPLMDDPAAKSFRSVSGTNSRFSINQERHTSVGTSSRTVSDSTLNSNSNGSSNGNSHSSSNSKHKHSAMPRLKNALSHVQLSSPSRSSVDLTSGNSNSNLQKPSATPSYSHRSSLASVGLSSSGFNYDMASASSGSKYQKPSRTPSASSSPRSSAFVDSGVFDASERRPSYASVMSGSSDSQDAQDPLIITAGPGFKAQQKSSTTTTTTLSNATNSNNTASTTAVSTNISPTYMTLPATLDPSELPLITNNVNSSTPPALNSKMSYPDPEQVLDTRSMYLEKSQKTKALQHNPVEHTHYTGDAQKPKRSKKSLFGKLTQRRDHHSSGSKDKGHGTGSSSTRYQGFYPPGSNQTSTTVYQNNSNSNSHHSYTLKAIGNALTPSSSTSSLGGVQNVGQQLVSGLYHHDPESGVHRRHGHISSQIGSALSSKNKTKSSSSLKGMLSNSSLTEVSRSSGRGKSVSASDRLGNIIVLDTNLDKMHGIVQGGDNYDPNFSRSSVSGGAGSRIATSWVPPESWGVASSPIDADDSFSDHADHIGIANDYDADYGDIKNKDPSSSDKPSNHCLRVFREDGTFGTLSCPIDITVQELLPILERKFFMNSISGYHLSIRTGKMVRILHNNDKPLLYQRMLLKYVGYTDRDRLSDVGRDDLSYLCRFELSKQPLRTFTHDEPGLSKDYKSVDLRNLSLRTIPIALYQHAYEIEELNVSENPSITVPLDFLQSCGKLKKLSFAGNFCRSIPVNFSQVYSLEELDLSNNLISKIDTEGLSALKNLKHLNLQGNRLTSIPDSFSKLRGLESINLSSNNITDFSPLCELDSLKSIEIGFNLLTSLPESISKLKNLERLIMPNNRLVKELPATFSDLTSLKELDVRFNQLQYINSLATLPNLEVFLCSKNSIYSFTESFAKLTNFQLDRNPITEIAFPVSQVNLTVLNLSKAMLTTLSGELLERLPMLEELTLDKNQLMNLPPAIGSLTRLVSLSVVGNALVGLPPEIGMLSRLERLDLHSNNIKALPSEIWNLGSLKYLNITSNLLVSFPNYVAHINSLTSTDSALYKNSGDLGSSGSSGNGGLTSRGSISRPADMDDYELRSISDRRPSTFSISSSALSPKDAMSMSRRGSAIPTNTAGGLTDEFDTAASHKDSITSLTKFSLRQSLAQSLLVLLAADNQFSDEILGPISMLTELEVLNLSHNELVEISDGSLGRLSHLRELYISGTSLQILPADDFESMQSLKIIFANGNKLHSLPSELSKVTNLQVLDIGSNGLKYNVTNWRYDWNWHWNLALRYLNFSGNKRLEIKSQHGGPLRGDDEHSHLIDFTVLQDIRVIGLMDVTLPVPSVPDQTENCRVRTYGSEVLDMHFGMADTLGDSDSLSMMDMVIEKFRGHEKEAIIGLLDGRNGDVPGGNKFAKLMQEIFGNILTDELSKLREDDTTEDALRRAFLTTNREIGNAIVQASEETGHAMTHRSTTASHLTEEDAMSGTCATIIYFDHDKMYAANVGDTMAVLAKIDGDYTVVTKRHDPTSPEELERIRGGAGIVSNDGLLDGVLDVSRIIGFYGLAPQTLAAPSISQYNIGDMDDFLIVASKQLWEYLSYEVAIDIARPFVQDPMKAAQMLRDFAIAYGCNKRIMVMVIGIGKHRRRTTRRGGVASNDKGGHENLDSTSMFPAEEEFLPSFARRKRGREILPEDSALARLGVEVQPPTGEVAMVFTDIKNSTLLWESYPVAMRSAIKVHNSIMRRNIGITRAYEVKTEGDAFIVSFSTPTAALLWCFSVQTQLINAEWPGEIVESSEGYPITNDKGELIFRGLSVRMGIHWGSPVSEPDPITKRMDYFGPMVNRTARISAVADGGQITVSQDFLNEIDRFQKAHVKYVEGASLADAYGDQALGASIDQAIKLLNNIGYVVEELGELKLKGLENPEMINVIYPNHLKDRLPYHKRNRQEEQRRASENVLNTLQSPMNGRDGILDNSNHRVTTSTAVAAGITCADSPVEGENGTRLVRRSEEMGAKAQRIGNLTLDHLTQLRWISNRLDKVCSSMSSGMKDIDQPSFGLSHEYNRKTSKNISSVVPNTDYDYIQFFDHLVTRIENAVGSLYLRVTAAALTDKYKNGEAFVSELGDIITLLQQISFRAEGREDAAKEFEEKAKTKHVYKQDMP